MMRVRLKADGRIVDGREHFYDLHAWDEFWA